MKTLTLSGWGQPYDALSVIAPDATHMDYARYPTVENALAAIADTARGYDRIIGWSLGGQLAARAIAQGLIAPKKLVLIAPPFQFVEISKNGIGMKRDTFDKFFQNFTQNPLRTLHKAWELVHLDDSHAEMIKNQLATFSKDAVLSKNWLNWLSLIEGYSCEDLDFSHFPFTLILHGTRDVVVEPQQSRRFAERIAGARLVLWEECGHAPHWHDTEGLKRLLKEHASV